MTDENDIPQFAASKIPVVIGGTPRGVAEIKDNIITFELPWNIAQELVHMIAMGLVTGMSLNPVYIEAEVTVHEVTIEGVNNNG